MKKNKCDIWIYAFIILTFMGIVDSLYLTHAHYNPNALGWCDISPEFNCDIVNRSEFSTLDGTINFFLGTYYDFPVSNALLSAFVFSLLFTVGVMLYLKMSWKLTLKQIRYTALIILGVSALFGLFLIYVQHVLLMTWCVLCITLDFIIFASLFCLWMVKIK